MWSLTPPGSPVPPTTRQSAEEQVRVILELPSSVLALLTVTLHNAGWTRGTAERELKQIKWWLS